MNSAINLIKKTIPKRSIKKQLARSGLVDPFKSLFKEIEFETTSYCNRKCNYCPNVEYERFGADSDFFMPENIFKTLIQQLKDMQFEGKIAPHLYGEPLIDPRMVEWIAYMRKHLPSSKLKIVTNGDYLTENKYKALRSAGLDVLFISKHSKKLKKATLKLLDSLSKDELEEHIVLNDFYTDFNDDQSMFTNRGGDIEIEKKQNSLPPIWCGYATYPVINTFGDIVLCCQDYQNLYISGNIMERHLHDIWWDPKNINLRRRIFQGYYDLDICQNCKM